MLCWFLFINQRRYCVTEPVYNHMFSSRKITGAGYVSHINYHCIKTNSVSESDKRCRDNKGDAVCKCCSHYS